MENFNLQFLQSELNRISALIQFSDKKSAFLSAYYSAIFGLIISQKGSILQNFVTYQKYLLGLYILVFLGIIISLLFGIFFLFKSIFPRLKNSLTDKSLFYFRHVAKMKFIDYFEEIRKLTDGEAKKQIIEQIYTDSIIANKKMKDVQRSTKSLIVLIILVFILFLL